MLTGSTGHWLWGGVLGALCLVNSAQAQSHFLPNSQVLDRDCPGGYQVSVADVNGDNHLDVLTLGKTVRWLRNDSWVAFPITGDQTQGNIDLAPADIDGDGTVDLAVASDFRLEDPQRGKLQWLRQNSDLKQPWQVIPVADVPSIHRIRWADLDGNGKKVLVAAPILGHSAKPPEYDSAGARLCFFRVPADPVHDRWTEEVIDEEHPVIHGLLVFDFDGDGRDDLLTASFNGVHLFQPQGQGTNLTWKKTHLAAGDQSGNDPAARGSSEIRVGQLKQGGRFLATIEPWHGNQVVIYTRPDEPDSLWDRHLLTNGLEGGHALAVLDANGDGRDDIMAGYRGNKGGVFLFLAGDDTGKNWTTVILDQGTLACQGLFVADVLGIGHPAAVGIGGSSHNVKLFNFGEH